MGHRRDGDKEATDMTHDQWNKLPLLLTRSQFLGVTGLTSADLSAMVRTGHIRPVQMPESASRKGKKRKSRYRKLDAAEIAGLEI